MRQSKVRLRSSKKPLRARCAIGLAGIASAQHANRLAHYLATIQRDPVKSGPLVVVDGAGTSFGPKLAVFGQLSAIVPEEMVVIDDALAEPNKYDGLPTSATV